MRIKTLLLSGLTSAAGLVLVLFIFQISFVGAQASLEADASVLWTDQFDSETLHSRWEWVRENPSRWSLTDRPGYLRIVTQEGSLSTSGTGQNILLTEPGLENYQISTKFDFNPTEAVQTAGLVIYQDDDNYVLLSNRYTSSEQVTFRVEANGEIWGTNVPVTAGTIYLRITKFNQGYTGEYSTDGNTWIEVRKINVHFPNPKVGLTAHNGPATTEINCDFDYFQLSDIENILFVAPGGDCGGSSPCYAGLQQAVDAAEEFDTIKVAAGTYNTLNVRPRNDITSTGVVSQVLYITESLTIQGGYTTVNWDTPDPLSNPTVLDAQGNGRVIYVAGEINPSIEGFTITDGDATGLGGWGSGDYDSGGGIYIISATASINDSLIQDNQALNGNGGGAFLVEVPAGVFSNTVFSSNESDDGGGVVLQFSSITFRENTFKNNEAESNGGGIDATDKSTVVIVDTDTFSNTAKSGGGIAVRKDSTVEIVDTHIFSNTTSDPGGGILLTAGAQAQLTDVTVEGNSADGGGGIAVHTGASAVISGTFIISNTSFEEGGGILILDTAESIVMTDTVISGNTAVFDGAGLYARNSTQVSMQDGEVAYNQVLTEEDAGNGGGLYFRGGAQATLTNMRIFSNTAAEGGGGLFFDDDTTTVVVNNSWIANNTAIGNYGAGGGGLGASNGSLIVSNSTIEGNSAPNNHGGGLFARSGGSIEVLDSKILNNSTKDHGGAVHADQAAITLTNVLIAGNQTTSGTANVLSVDDSGVTIMNSTISNNNPSGAQGILLWSGSLDITNSILWNNALSMDADPDCPSCFDVNYTNIEGGWAGTDNLNEDPLYIGGGNYHLGIGSPCINKGTLTGAPTSDIEGTSRDAEPDIGAYEFKLYDLTVYLVGNGTISSTPSGIDCGADCSESYANGTPVTLTATADTGSSFAGWSGACTNTSGDCVITMSEAKDVTATFTLEQYELTVSLAGTGEGTVSSTPAGISCSTEAGSDCTESYEYGTPVTLTAAADTGSTFASLGRGLQRDIGDCTVTITETRAVTATFHKIELFLPLVSR